MRTPKDDHSYRLKYPGHVQKIQKEGAKELSESVTHPPNRKRLESLSMTLRETANGKTETFCVSAIFSCLYSRVKIFVYLR